MGRRWSEPEAVAVLKAAGAEITLRFISIGFGGLIGLSRCSAYDFLRNHCGYKRMGGRR